MMLVVPALLCISTCAALAAAAAAPPVKRGSSQKYVVAHHMVGNTYPYDVSAWVRDIALAQSSGIDAFALNVGLDSWQHARVNDAYTAAQQLGTGFKLFLSFDMSALPCGSPGDAQSLVSWAKTFTRHPNQFIYPPSSPKAFVSTFSGENCYFGQSSPAIAWKNLFKNQFTGADSVTFVPSFFTDPNSFGSSGLANSMDGDFAWNSAWPAGVTTDSLNSALAPSGFNVNTLPNAAPGSQGRQIVQNIVGSLDVDNQHINAMHNLGGGRIYMAGLSPWFYTHYSPQTYNKNFVYLSDSLFPTRWTSLINARNNIDLVELVSWNDYGESHYLGPIEGAQPNSQAWVNGYDHTAWLDMNAYYAKAYKTGVYPTIDKDKIYMWAHAQMKDANGGDPVGKPNNYALSEDSIFVTVFATAPGQVEISASATNAQGRTFQVPAGVTQLNIPLQTGGSMYASLSRLGLTVLTVAPGGYTTMSNPSTYNYNAFVAFGSA